MYHLSKACMSTPFQTMIDLPKEVMELVYRQAPALTLALALAPTPTLALTLALAQARTRT